MKLTKIAPKDGYYPGSPNGEEQRRSALWSVNDIPGIAVEQRPVRSHHNRSARWGIVPVFGLGLVLMQAYIQLDFSPLRAGEVYMLSSGDMQRLGEWCQDRLTDAYVDGMHVWQLMGRQHFATRAEALRAVEATMHLISESRFKA